MEIILKDYSFLNTKINLTIRGNKLIGITGSTKDVLGDILSLRTFSKGTFIINDNKLTKDNINVFRKRIGFIPRDIDKSFYHLTVEEYLYQQISLRNLVFTDTYKKIKDALKIVGLSTKLLDRTIGKLSTLEVKHLLLGSILLVNPTVLIMDEPFLGIDLLNEKKIMKILTKISDKYQKTIIFISNDTDMFYKYVDEVIVLNDKGVLISGKCSDVLKDVDLLKKNKVDIPPIVEFTSLVREKGVKIDYHNDIRDIIKDIYKHV